jgi:porin
VEIGLTTAQDKMFNDNAHITLWNVDASEQAGTPSGWGVAGNLCKEVGKGWLPFLRGAWASRAGVFYESSVSFGVGYQPNPKGDLTAIGVNWGRPNRDVYGDNLGSQWTVEIFRRIQVTQQLEITPGVQLLQNPVLNPNEDLIGSFSLHVRRDF